MIKMMPVDMIIDIIIPEIEISPGKIYTPRLKFKIH